MEKVLVHCYETLDRQFIKKWSMKFVYSEGWFSRAKTLRNSLLLKGDVVYYPEVHNLLTKDLFAVSRIISEEFVSALTRLYPDICFFVNEFPIVLVEIIKKHEDPIFVINTKKSGFKGSLDVSKQKKKTLRFKNLLTKKCNSLVFYQDIENKLDISGCKRSIIPNIVHHLDLQILGFVVSKFRVSGRKI
jgi:hypothetical protein